MDHNLNPADRLEQMFDHQVECQPDETAIVDFDGRTYSYSQWADLVTEAVVELIFHGVEAGDRVMLVAENCMAFTAFTIATWRLGAWVVPLNARMSKGEVSRIVEHCQPRVIVYTIAASQAAKSHCDMRGVELETTVALAGSFGGVSFGLRDIQASATETNTSIAALMYTTGTTGNPKGVMLSHANLLFSSLQSKNIRELVSSDRLLCVLPLTHIFGFCSAFLGALQAGSQIHLLNRFDPVDIFAKLRDGISIMPMVPAMYSHLMNHAKELKVTRSGMSDLRYISAGGAPLDADWKRQVEAFFGLQLHNGYGMTEASPGIAATSQLNQRIDTSCGLPMPGLELKIDLDNSHGDPSAGIGEILVKGPNIMVGYYRNSEDTEKAIDQDGYFHTGDLGHIDAHGCLHIDGRCKELIIRSGFNVYPLEVEAAINRHPNVTQSAVVGRTLDGGNEEVLAFVQIVPGTSLDELELQQFLVDDLTGYKRPSRIIIAAELPSSSTGKILKHKLIEAFSTQL